MLLFFKILIPALLLIQKFFLSRDETDKLRFSKSSKKKKKKHIHKYEVLRNLNSRAEIWTLSSSYAFDTLSDFL